ncbi:MAG: DUF1499 domain-containing protein [Neptuniibacter sp.]
MPKLGLENGQLQPCPSSPNCVCSQVEDKAHFIEPIQVAASAGEAKAKLLQVLNQTKRVSVPESEDNYIRAEFTSLLFRFVDDVEFLITQVEPNETLIHVRSASRVGYSDFGVNRKRIEELRCELSESVSC